MGNNPCCKRNDFEYEKSISKNLNEKNKINLKKENKENKENINLLETENNFDSISYSSNSDLENTEQSIIALSKHLTKELSLNENINEKKKIIYKPQIF